MVRLFQLHDLALLEQNDLVRNLAACPSKKSQQQPQLREAVARRMPPDDRDAEPEIGHQPRLHPQRAFRVLAQRSQRRRRACELAHEHARRGLFQPLDVPQSLIQPDRDLEAEGNGRCVLAVRTARLESVALGSGQSGQRGGQVTQVSQDDVVGGLRLQHQPGIRDILRRRAPMNIAARVALTQLSQLAHQ